MYANTTGGWSLFDAVRNALAWFEDDHWKGPRPTDETVFDVTFVGKEERYFVRDKEQDIMIAHWKKKYMELRDKEVDDG